MLKNKGESRKVQGQKAGKSYKADNAVFKQPRILDRGEGSGFYMGSPKEEAKRLRAEKNVPGALGSKTDVDISKWTGKKK